jgi:hypothetical protein
MDLKQILAMWADQERGLVVSFYENSNDHDDQDSGFLNVPPRFLVDTYQSFGITFCLIWNPED